MSEFLVTTNENENKLKFESVQNSGQFQVLSSPISDETIEELVSGVTANIKTLYCRADPVLIAKYGIDVEYDDLDDSEKEDVDNEVDSEQFQASINTVIEPVTTPMKLIPAAGVSSVVKCQDNGVYHSISFLVLTASVQPVSNGFGSSVITGTSEKAKSNNQSFVLESDKVTVTVVGNISSTPFVGTAQATVIIDEIGQDVTKGI